MANIRNIYNEETNKWIGCEVAGHKFTCDSYKYNPRDARGIPLTLRVCPKCHTEKLKHSGYREEVLTNHNYEALEEID